MDAAPYPPERGELIRRIPFPVVRPPRRARTATAQRRDGHVCNLWATLGITPPAGRSPDETVTDWTPFP